MAGKISKINGFTLIELLVVISIIGIIAGIASIEVADYIRESRLTEYRDRLLADIEDTKLRSVTGTPRAIFINGGNSTSYSIIALVNDTNFKRDTGEATTTVSTVNLRSGMRISGQANGETWFDRKGIPRTNLWGTGGVTFTIWYDLDGNGTLNGNEPWKAITVSNQGRIQYEQ